MKDKIDQLFGDLQSRGFAKGKTLQQFRDYMLAPGKQGYNNRKTFFEDFKNQGMTDLETYEDFRDLIGLHAGKPERVTKPSYTPTAEEMSGFRSTIRNAGQTATTAADSYSRRERNLKQRQGLHVPGRVKLGESNNLVDSQPQWNPETGDMGNTYITHRGDEYVSRTAADLEQQQLDQEERALRYEREHPEEALESSIDRQIADLEQKRNAAYETAVEKARNANTPQSGIGKFIHDIFTPNREGIVARDAAMDIARTDKDVQTLDVALRDLRDAKTMMERNRQLAKSSDFLGGVGLPFTKDWFNNWKNFGYGMWDAVGDVTLNFAGTNDIEKAQTYLRIKDKMERGEDLSDSETDMALAGMSLAQAQQLADLPTGYTAGKTTAEMAPFMLQMAANPGSGIGKSFARQAVRKFGRNGIGAVAARVGARVAGNLGEAAILSNTLQAGKTASNIAQRYVGDFSYDEDGNIVLEGGKSLGRSVYEGEASSIIENFTELGAGGSINRLFSQAAGSKLGKKLGLGYISDLVGKVGSTPFARATKRFLDRTHYDGLIEEPLEEEYGIILNSLLGTGDAKISDLWDSKKQADIFAGTMWFGGMMSVMNTAAYPFARRAMKKRLTLADQEGQRTFGDEWEVMKASIDYMDDKDIPDFLYGLKDDDAFTNEQKAAMFGYASRLKQYQGANVADMLMRIEGNLSDTDATLHNAYESGAEAEMPDEMKQIVDEAQTVEEVLRGSLSEAEYRWITGNGPDATMSYILNHRDAWNDDEIAKVMDYYQKQARANGVMDAATDRVDLEVARANAEIMSNSHQQAGSVILAKGNGDMDFYVIGGDVVSDESGQVNLAGTGGAIVVKNVATGEVSVKSPEELMVYDIQNTDALIQQNETTLRQQLTQQADDDITFGSPAQEEYEMEDTVTLNDGEGGVIDGVIVQLPNALDGVYVVQTNDGKALQLTSDDINRRVLTHNGVEVVRSSAQPSAVVTDGAEAAEQSGASVEQSEEEIQSGGAGGEASIADNAGGDNPPASALSKIPVVTDEKGTPILKKGKPQYQWHKASVEDAASALVEKTGGDLLMARDTASDMVKNAQSGLEKIRKQKPSGEDPIEIADSRMEIKRQEQEQQAIIKQWQDVNQMLQRRMQEESARRQAEVEAAKSEEQKAREAEEARIREEKQDEIERQRLREAIAKEHERRNKEYEPLARARKEMADDSDAMAILQDQEPRDLREWVSSLFRPHSILWQDASDSEVGLRSELGLQRSDMQRFMTLLGTKENGAVPFGKAVLDIYEGLPESMKEQYTDQDVRNTVLDLFRSATNSREMMNITAENRIDEAKSMRENRMAREAELEMEAWAESYHLTPEERETFEEFMQMPPVEVEQEVINQIIAETAAAPQHSEQNEHEQIATSPAVGGESDGGGVPAGVEGGESQVQGTVEAAGNGNHAEGSNETAEAATGEPSVFGDEVAGGASADREALAVLFDQIGASPVLAERMSDYDVEQLTALVEDWEIANDEYGVVIEQQKAGLQSKNKFDRELAQKVVDEAKDKANEAFEPIEQYIEGLNVKYGIESEEPFDGAIPTPQVDSPRYNANRQALIDAYKSGDPAAITKAAQAIQQYVDEGLDAGEDHTEMFDIADGNDGNDPEKLADQYIIRTFWDRYLDDDADPEYIKTGLKPDMRQIAPSEQLKPTDLRDAVRVESPEIGVSEANAKAKEAAEEPQPIGTGDFGPIYDQFRGKPDEAVNFLLSKRDGEVLGALSHKDIGEIDLVWGQEGTGHSDGFGLAKLVKYHPEVVDNLQNILDDMEVVKRTDNRINLESEKYKAAVRLTWNEERKTWLLTVFEKKNSALDNTTDTGKTSNRGKRNDTATPQSTVSEGKDTNNSGNNQGNLGKTSSQAEISSEEAKVDTNPSEAQKEAGNYQKGHIKVTGLDISIENPKGSVRRGTDANGKEWESTMHNTYGYIRGTKGADKDHIDVFLSDNPTHSNKVFIVQQRKKVNGAWKFDELKVLLGFDDAAQASNAYLSNYEEGWDGMQAIIETDIDSFKEWLKNGNQKGTYKEDGAWAKVYPGVSDMVADEGEMSEPEQQEVEVLRGKGDNRMPGMGRELSEVPGGHGKTATPQSDTGQNRRERELLQGELQVDGLGNPITEPKDGSLPDVQGQDNVNAAVGRGNGAPAEENKVQNPDVPLGRRQDTGNSRRDQGQLQNDNISGQNNENGGLGERTQYELQNAEKQDKAGLDNGKDSHDTDEHKADGKVKPTDSRESVIRDAVVDHLRSIGVEVSTDWQEGQRILDEYNGNGPIKKMGQKTNKKKAQIAADLEGNELTPEQQAVVDVYTGKSNNSTLSFTRDGKQRRVIMRKGNEVRAGAEHSLFRHYGTTEGVISSEDVLRIPDVLATGERTPVKRGKTQLYEYTLTDANGVKYTVVTENKHGREEFADFYTNKKGDISRTSTPSEEARASDTDNALSGAKVQQNSETAKDSEEKIKEQKAREVSMKPIDADIPNNPTIRESLDIMDKVKDIPIEKVLEAYNRLNSQMLEEGGLNVDEHEMKVKREWMAEHGTEGLGQTMADHLKYLSDKYGYGKLQLRWELLDRLEEAGIDPKNTTSSPGNTTAKLVTMRPKFFRTPDGHAFGYTYRGKIYIDPRIATAETPVHEYGHLWCEMKRNTAPEEWNQMKQVMLNDEVVQPIIERVRRDYPELAREGKENDFIEEVITQFSGKRGAERLKTIADEVAAERGGIFGKAEAVTAMQRLKNILNSFWAGVARMMGWKYRNANQIADRMMSDLLDGVNPVERMKKASSQVKSQQEIERTLMGVHNLSEDKLRKVIKAGGLANPSLAVVDTKQGIHTQYGDISLIPKASLIDKHTGRNAGTFAGDAWTPTYPHVERMLTKQGEKRAAEIAKEVAGDDEETARHIRSRINDYFEGNGDRMHFLFLKQKGLDPQIRKERIAHSQEEYDAITKIFGEPTSNMPNRESITKEQNDALVDLMVSVYEKKLREGIDPEKPLTEKMQNYLDTRVEEYRKNLLDDDGYIWFAKGDNFIYDNWRDEKRRQNPQPDWYGTDNDASYQVAKEGLSEEYEKWKESLLTDDEVEEKLFAGYTPSGNRRYLPNTVENASRLMNKNSDQNAYDQGGFGPTRAMLLQNFASLADIRRHKDLIQKDEKVEGRTKELSDELFDIINQISDMQKISDNRFLNIDYAEARLQEAMGKKNPIRHLNKEYGYDIPEDGELASQLMNFMDDVRNLPAKYFETKFKRPVTLDEFEIAVVPEDTSEDVVKALKDAGLEVRTFDNTGGEEVKNENRRQAVIDAVQGRDDIMFQKRGKVRYFDKMEAKQKSEVRKRLENEKAIPVKENTITKREGVSARNAAMEWANENIPEAKTVSTEIGDLIINKKSISDSLAHGFSQSKLDAIPTLLPAFEDGHAVYVGSGEDVNGNPITDHYFAYPIDYKGNREYVFCRTREDQNTHRLYIHEVITGEDIKNGQTLQSTAPEKPRTGLPLYRNIMSDVFGSKVTKKSDTLQENGEENADEAPKFQKAAPVEPEDEPVNLARKLYEDAIRDTGERSMIPALLGSISRNNEGWIRFKHKFAESWFDYSRSIKALQDAIEKATGKAIEGFEEVWRALNSKSSIDSVELQRVMHDLIEPLSEYTGAMIKGKKIDGRKMTVDDVEIYLNAVHGIERNEQMAMKQARDEYEEDIALQRQQLESGELGDRERKSLEAALLIKEARFKGISNYMDRPEVEKWYNQWRRSLENARRNGTISEDEYNKASEKMDAEYNQGWQYKYREKDYSGLTALFGEQFEGDEKPTEDVLEQAARDYASKFEDIVGKKAADGLWERVKALNTWSLRKSYESGLISKDQYNDTLTMYQHYVPLRGWHDDYAGDVYQYISRGEPAEVLQGVLKKAYGRKSRAARIFGTMAAMANTAIVQGNKNLVGQHLLNMAMNHQDSGLLMVSEQYYQKTADGDLVPQVPALTDTMTADEMRQELERFEADMKAREDAGEVQKLRKKFKKEMPLHMAKWQEQRHAVRVMRGGREYMVYVLGNPRAAMAFNGLLNPNTQPGVISNNIARYMRFKAKMQTSLSPEFLISNFERDMTTAATGAYIKFGKEYQKQFVGNLTGIMPLASLKQAVKGKGADNLGGIFSLFRKYDAGTLDESKDVERYFKEFVDSGGMTGISYITRAEEYQESMEKIVKRMRQGKMGRVRSGMKAVGDAVEFANKGIENATRFATYMTSRQQGRSVRDSIFDAKEGSVNFNMKGSGAWGNLFARQTYLYVNPAMQSLRMLGTWYENDPVVATRMGGKMVARAVGRRFMKAAAVTMTASVTTAMLNILLSQLFHGDDDDDDKEKGDWWALSEWNRYNFVNVINPFGKGYFHWSIPQELRPLWAMGQIGIDMAFGRVVWQRGLESMLLQLNNLSPLSFFEGGTDTDESLISAELRTLTPSYVSDFTDAYGWNKDFMGHPVTNQGEWNKDRPEWQRAGKNTPEIALKASRKWNELTGGRRNSKSWADSEYLNPSAVYYVLVQQFGGIGSMAKRLLSAVDQWRDPDQSIEKRNLPFLPKFYVETGDDYSRERVVNDKFWMYYNEFMDADHEMSHNRSDVKSGKMTQAEADRAVEERKADGTYDTWKTFRDNGLDYLFKQVRGTDMEREVKRMAVEAMEKGVAPDYDAILNSPGDHGSDALWAKARTRQTERMVEDMEPEEVAGVFDKTDDPRQRKEMARRISKDAGASKDPYGDKPSSDHAYQYQLQRTAEDVREDAVLLDYQEKLRERGDEEAVKRLSNERKQVHSPAEHLHGGKSDKVIMDYIRRSRKELMRKYGLTTEKKKSAKE